MYEVIRMQMCASFVCDGSTLVNELKTLERLRLNGQTSSLCSDRMDILGPASLRSQTNGVLARGILEPVKV